jgi:hypothetical protein
MGNFGPSRRGVASISLALLAMSIGACASSPAKDHSKDAGEDGAAGEGRGDASTAGMRGTIDSSSAAGSGADSSTAAAGDGSATTATTDGGDGSAAGDDGGSAIGVADAGACPTSPDGNAPSGPDDVIYLANVSVGLVAGTDVAGDVDGTVAQALFSDPVSVIVEPAGSLIVCDFQNDALRRVVMPTATVAVSTLTKQAGFSRPYGMTYGIDGALYVDTDYNTASQKSQTSGTIWKVDATTGVATVVAQNLGRPRGLATLPDGRLVLGDYENQRVRLLDPATGAVTDLAGQLGCPGLANANGSNALFNTPYGVGVLPSGAILVADEGNHVVRAISATGDVTTYAGDGGDGTVDGPRLSSRFSHPTALAIDAAGDVFVADYFVHRIRRIAADGTVTTVAGDGTGGYVNGAGAAAELYGIEGIAVTADGTTLFVADGSLGDAVPYNRIRVVTIGP